MNTVHPPHSQYAGLQLKQLQAVALAADDVYKKNLDTLFTTKRTIRRFWPIGDLIACSRVDQETDTVIVAIRGTSEFGNWIFTNFQAFYTKLQLIDDSLKTDGVVFQAGTLKNPIAGSMHQGFIRGFRIQCRRSLEIGLESKRPGTTSSSTKSGSVKTYRARASMLLWFLLAPTNSVTWGATCAG